MTPTREKSVHQGRNVKRFREMRGLKQEGLAWELGDDWNQKKVSLLEAKEEIEPAILEQVAKVLKIPVEAFTDLDEDSAINIISNTVNNNDHATGNSLLNYYPNINPVDKWLEALEEIKKLNHEKIELYERMLKDKSDMLEKLERLLSGLK
ncbi:MAG TPA: helix-turn-helix transcriptional regulator [Flavisolibacter sp.]|jgi:transcriptional regulator with XRE-family HTH domain|nr:helix-turn-helix transcriptional regulator [Flavisolibacter sp.]